MTIWIPLLWSIWGLELKNWTGGWGLQLLYSKVSDCKTLIDTYYSI